LIIGLEITGIMPIINNLRAG